MIGLVNNGLAPGLPFWDDLQIAWTEPGLAGILRSSFTSSPCHAKKCWYLLEAVYPSKIHLASQNDCIRIVPRSRTTRYLTLV